MHHQRARAPPPPVEEGLRILVVPVAHMISCFVLPFHLCRHVHVLLGCTRIVGPPSTCASTTYHMGSTTTCLGMYMHCDKYIPQARVTSQITDVHRNGQHISVQYTPNVLKRATKRDLVKQFLTPAKKSSQRRATKGAAAPGQEGSNRLDIVCNSAAEAAELAAALGAALERFCGTMEYLDTTLPPPDGKTYVEVVTLEPTGGQADGGVGEAEAVWLVARQPAWGQEMIVPVCEFTVGVHFALEYM